MPIIKRACGVAEGIRPGGRSETKGGLGMRHLLITVYTVYFTSSSSWKVVLLVAGLLFSLE